MAGIRSAPTGASVTILAVSPFGVILRPLKVTRFAGDNGRGRDYSSQFTEARAQGIPYGMYMAQVTAGGRVIAAPVRVAREDTLVVLSGPGEIIERGAGLTGVVGRVTGADGINPVWIRLVRVFSEDVCCTIVPLSEDGTFGFGGLDSAEYVLLVLSDGRVLFDGRVRIETTNAFIDVDLAKALATVQPR